MENQWPPGEQVEGLVAARTGGSSPGKNESDGLQR